MARPSTSFEGDFYGYTGVSTASRPVQEHLPLKIGAMGGPKSMELAGEIADRLHTACAYSPDALAYAVEHFQAGAAHAGRSADELDLGDALAATPDEVADRIMVAGTAEDWVRWLTDAYASAGLNHALVSFTDPFTPKAWAGIDIDGLPDLVDQV